MARAQKSAVVVIGVGNPYRSDDAAGLRVVERLSKMGVDAAILRQHSGEGASLMESWQGARSVILIDAVSSGAPPGILHRLEPLREPLPRDLFRHSTHAFSVPEAVELARALHQLPERLLVIGIEGQNFAAGTELSPAVAAAVPEAARCVLQELSAASPR